MTLRNGLRSDLKSTGGGPQATADSPLLCNPLSALRMFCIVSTPTTRASFILYAECRTQPVSTAKGLVPVTYVQYVPIGGGSIFASSSANQLDDIRSNQSVTIIRRSSFSTNNPKATSIMRTMISGTRLLRDFFGWAKTKSGAGSLPLPSPFSLFPDSDTNLVCSSSVAGSSAVTTTTASDGVPPVHLLRARACGERSRDCIPDEWWAGVLGTVDVGIVVGFRLTYSLSAIHSRYHVIREVVVFFAPKFQMDSIVYYLIDYPLTKPLRFGHKGNLIWRSKVVERPPLGLESFLKDTLSIPATVACE